MRLHGPCLSAIYLLSTTVVSQNQEYTMKHIVRWSQPLADAQSMRWEGTVSLQRFANPEPQPLTILVRLPTDMRPGMFDIPHPLCIIQLELELPKQARKTNMKLCQGETIVYISDPPFVFGVCGASGPTASQDNLSCQPQKACTRDSSLPLSQQLASSGRV